MAPNGNVRYHLKTPYRDGTTHFIFEPLYFIAPLATLVRKPRVDLALYHGAFASIVFFIRNNLFHFRDHGEIAVIE